MLLRRNHRGTWYAIGFVLLVVSISVGADITRAGDDAERWRDSGVLMLYRLGMGRHPSVEWFDPDLQVVDPDSREAVRMAQATMQQALEGYGHDAIALKGRIPLDTHPQCVLGLCLAEQFPDTRLGNSGHGQFVMCVEQALFTTMSPSNTADHDMFERALLAVDTSGREPGQGGAFAATETPYLCLYLLREARAEDVRMKARECLARSLWKEYGLEPGLGQYLHLLNDEHLKEGLALEVATLLDQIGVRSKAKAAYTHVLENTKSVDQARPAFEGLARILCLESRQRDAVAAWEALLQRFPNTECATGDVKDLLDRFHNHREETSKQLASALTNVTNASQALPLCRTLSTLWTAEEAPHKWQAVIDGGTTGSLIERLGRVFSAKALLDTGEVDAAESAIRGLMESIDPVVRAQSLVVAAEIAHAKGQWDRSVDLYAEALRISRPTYLPDWTKELLQIQSPQANAPVLELQSHGRFLRAGNHLVDGDYAAAMEDLRQVATDLATGPASLESVLPCVMMLACLGMEDYAEAEAWGHRIIKGYCRANRSDSKSIDLLAGIRDLDAAICKVLIQIRNQKADPSADAVVVQNAIHISRTGMELERLASHTEAQRNGVQQLYIRAKKRHTAQVLTAEYGYLRQQSIEDEATQQPPRLEPLLFAAFILSEESVGRIRERLLSLTNDGEDINGRLCRFAMFAQKANRLDLATSLLNVAVGAQESPAYVEALEGIAEMYLAVANHQSAIDAYERIAGLSQDPARVQAILRKVIDIYAEDLKNYDKAIQTCEAFISRYPDSPSLHQTEFVMGKLSYRRGDYSGAVGQLDGLVRKYPQASLTRQAMMLAGLSRMAEGNTDDAIRRFAEIIRRHPDGELAARSKFLIGYAQISSQQYARALETFKQLIEQFSESQYVPQAKRLMDRLRKVAR